MRWMLGGMLVALSVPALAQGQVEQRYLRPRDDLRAESAQSSKGEKSPRWVVKKTNAGLTYYKCVFQATNRKGDVLNQQTLWYFPNDPAPGKSTDASNYWVYWYNPATDVVWGRCPTPKHPMYREWQKSARGKELWQVIPEDKRKDFKGVVTISKVGPGFGEVFSREATGLPKVAKGETESITCVDFKDPAFN